jgi:hypothetical protein
MADRHEPLTSREALTFEDASGTAVLSAVAQLRAGELTAAAAAAALLVIGRRNADDVTLDDVFDSHPAFTDLSGAGTAALEYLLADEEG